MIVLFLNFFMKCYVEGTHYNHLFVKILICNHSNSFYEEISKNLFDSFYCMPFLLDDWLQRFTGLSRKEKQRDHNLLSRKIYGKIKNFFRNGSLVC